MRNKKTLNALSASLIALMKIVIPDNLDAEKEHLTALKEKFRDLERSVANLSEADLLDQIKVIALGATHYN